MSERIPTAEDIRLALTTVGYTEDEAAEGVERIKKRGIGIGHEMARETMQASIGDAFRKAQAVAWDEGAETAWKNTGEGFNGEYAHGYSTHDGTVPFREATDGKVPNPYREDGDE